MTSKNTAIKTIALISLFFVNAVQADSFIKKNYQQLDVLGWNVMISNAVVKDKELYQKITKLVYNDLQKISDVVPKWSVKHLKKTPIFFEKTFPKPIGNRLFFNGLKKLSRKYKITHTYGAVVAGSTKSYIAMSTMHRWQMLHELTHAYHQFVTKHNYKPIKDAYKNAMAKKLHSNASQYPRKNQREYFSTLTEAYFGTRVSYPQNRKELAEHDPIGYCAIVKAWGAVGNQEGTVYLNCKK